jgi:phage terminase small subunit
MTPKQARFVEEYLVDLNATQAATRAGYSARTANEQGARLLAKASVQEAIQVARVALSARTEITQETIMADIEAIKRDAMQAVYDDGGNKAMLDHKAALRACELQGKRYGMFDDRLKVSGSVSLTLMNEFPDE